MARLSRLPAVLLTACLLAGCAAGADAPAEAVSADTADEQSESSGTESENAVAEPEEAPAEDQITQEGDTGIMSMFDGVEKKRSFKPVTNANPVMTQRFGADPWAMVYDGRVYLYMTCDIFMYDAAGKLQENNYSKIDTISVASSADLVNWTDHGEVHAAGKSGAASWGGNSWAPAAAWKNIDGKDRFFLYFANSGNGIAVLSSDSPTGPFTDPIGGPLISRKTPTCAEVTWLFDPAVLMDDDGNAYIYFGGGVPSPDKAADPGTARVAKLGADMISLDGDPVPIENVAYLFEDSGINKINGKYYYSYCSNFNVTPEAEEKYGFSNGEIVTMVGDDPMGPFTYSGPVLKNPQVFFKRGGNNHHCMFEFNGQWYIAYHTRILEEGMELDGGYRSTNIDLLTFDEEGRPAPSKGTREGVAQVGSFDPYSPVPAATMADMAGLETIPEGDDGTMLVKVSESGSWLLVRGVDFGDEGASSVVFKARGKGDAAVRIALDVLNADPSADIALPALSDDLAETEARLPETIKGKHDLYLIFAGEELELAEWRFVK